MMVGYCDWTVGYCNRIVRVCDEKEGHYVGREDNCDRTGNYYDGT